MNKWFDNDDYCVVTIALCYLVVAAIIAVTVSLYVWEVK